MLNFLKKLFGAYDAPKTEAPYKVEAPAVEEVKAPTKCGCGRSPSGNCVGLHALSEDAWAVHPDNPKKVEKPAVTEAPAVKVRSAKPKAPKAPKAEKEATKKAPAKSKKPKSKQ